MNGKKNVSVLYENDDVDPETVMGDKDKYQNMTDEELEKELDYPHDIDIPTVIPKSY